MLKLIVTLLINTMVGVGFGIATQHVIESKGYTTNWFWWGFFFGFPALLVAMARSSSTANYPSSLRPGESTTAAPGTYFNPKVEVDPDMDQGEWRCDCGRINKSYTSTCACGKTRMQ